MTYHPDNGGFLGALMLAILVWSASLTAGLISWAWDRIKRRRQ